MVITWMTGGGEIRTSYDLSWFNKDFRGLVGQHFVLRIRATMGRPRDQCIQVIRFSSGVSNLVLWMVVKSISQQLPETLE